jgi:hypothetical protein
MMITILKYRGTFVDDNAFRYPGTGFLHVACCMLHVGCVLDRLVGGCMNQQCVCAMSSVVYLILCER